MEVTSAVPEVWPAPRPEDRIWTPQGMCLDFACDHDDGCPGPVWPGIWAQRQAQFEKRHPRG